MLQIKKKSSKPGAKLLFGVLGVGLLVGGFYLLSLVIAPNFPQLALKPITPDALAAPKKSENRIIIPKIGVNIPYGEGKAALDKGAWWRYPERGNPEKGGNFIVAAHRFSIQPTPQSTIAKSPFYNIDKIKKGDQILIDYNGVRYAYEASEFKDVKPTAVEIEAPSETSKLTLYSCTLSGSTDGRVVIVATPKGKAANQ